jgi:[ribosomal protein S18]-alanine N-acetyltransferase
LKLNLRIRSYRAEDFEALLALDTACFPAPIAYSPAEMRQYLGRRGAACFVAVRGRELAGFVLTHDDGNTGHIITLDVIPGARRCGIGTTLLREAEQQMRSRGVSRVFLEAAVSNSPAVAFWQAQGYTTAGVLQGYYHEAGDAYVMMRFLGKKKETQARCTSIKSLSSPSSRV